MSAIGKIINRFQHPNRIQAYHSGTGVTVELLNSILAHNMHNTLRKCIVTLLPTQNGETLAMLFELLRFTLQQLKPKS